MSNISVFNWKHPDSEIDVIPSIFTTLESEEIPGFFSPNVVTLLPGEKLNSVFTAKYKPGDPNCNYKIGDVPKVQVKSYNIMLNYV